MNNVIFEVVPPSKRSSSEYFDRVLRGLIDSINRMKSVKSINIPEIVDENFCGEPYCRNMDNRELGRVLKEKCDREIMLNKCVVYFNSKDKFSEWLDTSVRNYGFKEFVFVGGTHQHRYPGPTVLEANSIALEKKLRFGNITIPTRPDEVNSLISKTKSGCQFFTTQILFEDENIINLIKKYAESCRQNDIKPNKFCLSFSPISDLNDVEFLRWLGVDISEKTSHRLIHAVDRGEESVKLIQEVADSILANVEGLVPIALNIEQVTFHNLKLSEKLVEIFS